MGFQTVNFLPVNETLFARSPENMDAAPAPKVIAVMFGKWQQNHEIVKLKHSLGAYRKYVINILH